MICISLPTGLYYIMLGLILQYMDLLGNSCLNTAFHFWPMFLLLHWNSKISNLLISKWYISLCYTQEYWEEAGLHFQAYLDSTSHSLIDLNKKHHLPLWESPIFATIFTFSIYFDYSKTLKILLSKFHIKEDLLLQFLFVLFILYNPKNTQYVLLNLISVDKITF